MSDFYEKNENMLAHTSVPWQQEVLLDFLGEIGNSPAMMCLDVGSGIGNNIATLLSRCENIHAVDVSERALGILRERYAHAHERLVVQKMDAAELHYPNALFNLVVCTEVLEHCREPQKVLCECTRVLKPGGTLIVSSPNYLNPAGAFKKFYERVYPRNTWDAWGNHDEGRENFTTAPKLAAWTKAAGIFVLSTRGGDLIRSWFPFLRKHYETIDRHPMLGIGRWWPFKFFMMNYFIMGNKPNSRR